jgi:hypothetical protein
MVGSTIGSVLDSSTAGYSLATSASWCCHDSPKHAALLKLPSTTFGYTSFAVENRRKHGEHKLETFKLLDFTYICGRICGNRGFIVKRETATKRL